MHHNDTEEPVSQPIDRVLLVRFLAGEASPAEAAAVERWLAADPACGVELAELRRIWARAGALPSEARIDALWHDLRRQMREPVISQSRPRLDLLQPSRPRARRRVVAGLAAAGIAAVAAGIALRAERAAPAPVAAESPEQVYSTARGQRSVVELADGSSVALAADSRIRVRFHDDGRREVHLDGEAVFDVVHDERRPFLVYSRNAVTEDLGTRFGIRAYPGDSTVRVVVVSGKVALRPAEHGAPAPAAPADALLGPGDLGELGSAGEPRVRRGIDADSYLAWTRGRLVFEQASIREIAAQLGRWYDVEIVIADPAMADRRVTLTFDAPSLAEVLDAVAVPLGWRHERSGRRVVLHP